MWRQGLRFCAILLTLAALLGAEYWTKVELAHPLAAEIRNELVGVFQSVETQWMAVGWLALYLGGFIWLRYGGRPHTHPLQPEAVRIGCLLGLLVIALGIYAWGYGEERTPTEVPVLIGGMMLGQGAGCWQTWRQRQGDRLGIAPLVVGGLVLLLALAALWHADSGVALHYWGATRWHGIWNNPNKFGMLMAVGLVLAIGLALAGTTAWPARNRGKLKTVDGGTPVKMAANPASKKEKRSLVHRLMASWKTGLRNLKSSLSPWLQLGLPLTAGVPLAIGLVNSYSRGAWLGALTGLAYFGWQVLRSAEDPGGTCALPGARVGMWLRRNWKPLAVIACSLTVLGYWNFHHTGQPLVRRVFSVANPYDFSWQNRVTTWEGALQMMADRPWFGWGWKQVLAHYEAFYMPGKLTDGRALWSNDFFMLGLALGVPALACFMGYVMLSLGGGSRGESPVLLSRPSNPEPSASSFSLLVTTCRAGAVVLLVSFWFDGGPNGGLFKLATGATFWILLELGAGAGRAKPAEAALKNAS